MTTPSNLYAEKIFAEHPLAMWPLDESVDYLSLISEPARDIENFWTVSPYLTVPYQTIAATPEELLNIPFENSAYYKFGPVTTNATLIETMSFMPTLAPIPLTSFNSGLENFAVSFSLKALHSYTVGVEIGYVLSNTPFDTNDFQLGRKELFSAPVAGEWSMYSATLDLPESTSYTHIYPFISIKYVNQDFAGNPGTGTDYAYIINGISMGQWSEMYNASSLGIEAYTAMSDTNINADGYISGGQYGLGANDARYLVVDNKLLAQNTSMPMVYGSSNLTKIIPNPVAGSPSLIVPGLGMMHDSGRYNTYTFETWIRIDSRTSLSRKILGPVFSDNGLYVDGPFLRLKAGSVTGSYFVGEWYRPMLVNIRLGLDAASLLINGEEVISFEFSTEEADYGNNTDYVGGIWGFYAYEDVPIVEIDCPAIYSYSVPAIVAKRRFGFGQAVESPDGVNKSFGASTAFIDYSVADYTNNYHYPDMGDWSQGITENVITDNNTLATPEHELPDFVFQSTNYDTWFAAQSAANPYCTFNGNPGFIRFNDLSISDQSTKAAYIIFGVESFTTDEQILFKIVNKITGDFFAAKLVFDEVIYTLTSKGIEQQLDVKGGVVLNQPIFAGAAFDALGNTFGADVQSFFSNSSQLLMFVAGDSSYENLFVGNIYKVGLATQRNLATISSYFSIDEDLGIVDGGLYNTATWLYVVDGGTPSSFNTDAVYSHIATYTLVASNDYGIFKIDIDSDSYWQDYVPLSYFSQFVKNELDQDFYDLDFIQFNINYPAIPKFLLNSYITENELVRTYVSFQLIAEGANKQLSSFSNIEPASENGVLNPTANQYQGSWLNTAYEVVDGTIIYPPRDISFDDVAIVTHVVLKVRNGLSNKVEIKKIQYASQAFNALSANPIGTKFDVPVYPYQKYAAYFDYKSRNPHRIYKGSTPHLYLTRKTGIQKVGDYDPLINRGFLVNVNNKQADEYRVIASQMFLYYDKDTFPSEQVKIFEIQSQYSYVKVYMEPLGSSRKRARIFAINANTGTTQDAIAFYINGKLVKDPVINVNEWTTFGIRFAQPIVFDNVAGAIRFTGPLLVNSISYYESSSLQEVERQSVRLWDAVEINGTDWQYWLDLLNQYGETYQWGDVLVISSTQYAGIDPSDIYRAYTGTNKIIGDDNATFYLGGAGYKVTNGQLWSTYTEKPL